MKRVTKIVLVVSLVAILALSMIACTDTPKDGKSAYDIAVENGFEGSEQEWLDSLHGTNGTNGVNGANGQNGTDGTTITPESLLKMYKDAQIEGYTGSYVEFLKELGIDAKGVLSSEDNTAAINKASRSIVSIMAYRDESKTRGSAGSGVIYELDKTNGNASIITNFHVVYAGVNGVSENIYVNLFGEEIPDAQIRARFIGGSEYYDIAVIQITNSDRLKASYAEQAIIEESRVLTGTSAIAIGNAMGEGIAATEGIISKDVEDIQITTASGKNIQRMQVMRIDAPVNGGNSGGGLFNNKGHLIGIVNAKKVKNEHNGEKVDGVCYAIPLSIALSVANNVLETCDGSETRVFMAKLAVEIKLTDAKLKPIEVDGATYYVTSETVQVGKVHENGTAAKMGMLPGDILVSASLKGKTYALDDFHGLTPLLLSVRANDTLSIKVKRDDLAGGLKEVNLECVVEEGDLVVADQDKFAVQVG